MIFLVFAIQVLMILKKGECLCCYSASQDD